MFRHNLLLTYRHFKNNKQSFFINFIGLSIGLACTLFIYLWVSNELNIDKFHEKDDQLFQVLKNVGTTGDITTVEYTQGRLAEVLREEIPEIEHSTSVVPSQRFSKKGIIGTSTVKVKAHQQYVGKEFFGIFSYQLIQGDKSLVFSDPTNIVVSQQLAEKLFGTSYNVIGKVVDWDHEMLPGKYTIAGIVEDPPLNSSKQYEVLFSYEWFIENNPKLEKWTNSDPETYVVIKEGSDLANLESKITNLIEAKAPGSKQTCLLQQFSRRYLFDHFENGRQSGGRIAYVRMFSIVGVILLVIACINYINLSTVQGLRRYREIGLKKVVGARRRNLIFQYLTESLLLVFFSAILSLLVVFLLLPWFESLTGKQLSIILDFNIIITATAIVLVTGLLAGSYPALYFAGFDTVGVLKGRFNASFDEAWTRRALVILQFGISIIMIAAVLVVHQQTKLIQTKNLGYNRNDVIYFESGQQSNKEGEAFIQDLENLLYDIQNLPGVINASNFRHSLIERNGGTTDVQWPGKVEGEQIVFTDIPVGYDFINTLDMEIKEGRSFSRKYGSEKQKVVFNETAISIMGLEDPIGETVKIWGEDREIIGVVKDFHFQSLYENIKPLFFDLSLNPRVSNIIVRLNSEVEKEATIENLKNVYGKHYPQLAFEYSYLDLDYQALYDSENRIAILSKYFTGLAIFISCLGFFGLAAFSTQRRVKEIGIRKILGSSPFGIFCLLTKEFTQLLIIAIVVSLPVSYFITRRWLTEFAYRIDLSWWIFALAGIAAILIAWVTLSLEIIKASQTNPVECLRDE